jgi:hypothetical protein
LHHIEELSERRKEVMMVISDLKFMKYLCIDNEPPAKKLDVDIMQGDFDLLIIHPRVGIVVGEVSVVRP